MFRFHRGTPGFLLVVCPLPLLFPWAGWDAGYPPVWQAAAAAMATLFWAGCGLALLARLDAARSLGLLAAGGSLIAALPGIVSHPALALAAAVLFIAGGFHLLEADLPDPDASSSWVEPVKGAFLGLPVLIVADIALGTSGAWTFFCLPVAEIRGAVVIVSLISLVALSRITPKPLMRNQRGLLIDNHPARLLVITFLILCTGGALALMVPFCVHSGHIHPVDAVFTAVSAVCVTGLTVVDTGTTFTPIGQGVILMLIQLGGLGIMSITTIAFHAMGMRLSLNHERMLMSLTDTDHHQLLRSLTLVVTVTLVLETVAALLLTLIFYSDGMPLLTALWQGCFTAVSAFCNAGFSLNPDSLISYQTSAFVLHLVALLIICGGLAPATLLMIPQWMKGRKIDLTARLTLVTTLILLISGMILLLAFEWNGLFQGLSVTDKIHNAWFHAATLRTAGFNSVDTAAAGGPGFLVMLVFMFIGGSPGGTAGGVKTTTIAVLALTFYTTITGARDIVIRNQRISGQVVNRAVTILISVLLVWFVLVLMLAVTQPGIPVRDLIFEAVSAMTTTGLSTGATVMLDDMGKIIISLAMFCGRIGPMTLFMILGNDPPPSRAGCPDARIFLT